MPTQSGNMRRPGADLPAPRTPCRVTVRTARSAKLQPAADADADVDAGTGLTGLWQVLAQKTGAEPNGPANQHDLSA